VLVGDRIEALVHVDRYWDPTPFRRSDLDAIQALCDVTGLALERLALTQRLCEAESGEANAAGAAGFAYPDPSLASLTTQETRVATMIADGLTNPQIAKELFVAEATVKTHVKHILRKLGATHRAEVVCRVLGRSSPGGTRD
jgi:DNA-binding CsgD family transcriptional regulator